MKFYITTPIFYANARLHMGHTYTLVLADILARYHRAVGDQTFFLTGSDEHGEKIARAAQKEGLGPQVFVNGKAELFQELLKELHISNDTFIRTSDQKRHWPGAVKLWLALEASGDIYQGIYHGLYCVGCEAFVTEKELVNGKCVLHDMVPEKVEEENLFFKLSRYSDELKRLIESGELKITPESRGREMLALIGEGLADVSISRLMGGVPWGVPLPSDPSKVMYVWCDALSSYLSALGYGSDDETNVNLYWPADVQILGKDILRFHALLWPALLLSAHLTPPKELLVHGFITSGGAKMSKTLGNVLDPEEFIKEYGIDALRYYLAREVSTTEDGDLTREKFKETYNANLANGLGNLVSRTLKMATQYFDGTITSEPSRVPPLRVGITVASVIGDLEGVNIPYVITNDILPRYHAFLRAHEIPKAMDVVWELVGHLDGYITSYEPFKLIKTDPEMTERVMWGLVYGLREIAGMLSPMMPQTAEKITELITVKETESVVTFTTAPLSAPLFMRKE
jgi:methionyl-tRNA synthetase